MCKSLIGSWYFKITFKTVLNIRSDYEYCYYHHYSNDNIVGMIIFTLIVLHF